MVIERRFIHAFQNLGVGGCVFETSLSFSIGLHFNDIYFQPIPDEIQNLFEYFTWKQG